MNMSRFKGFIMVILGASLWGISGTVAQDLFQVKGVNMNWLVTVRLLLSGFLLICFASLSNKRKEVWTVWKDSRLSFQFMIFGILGMLGVQYTYFASIETGNTAVAALLQYLAPLFILIYYVFCNRSIPNRYEIFAIVLALSGTFLLLTNGSVESLTVPFIAMIWGVLSGVALAFYTIYSSKLLKKWSSPVVVGWGMIIGGIGLSFVHPPWELPNITWTIETLLFISFVILFGTLIAFYFYIESLKYISPKESSLLGCTEPLVAVVSTVLWFQLPFGLYQVIGTVFIISMVIWLTFMPDRRVVQQTNTLKRMSS